MPDGSTTFFPPMPRRVRPLDVRARERIRRRGWCASRRGRAARSGLAGLITAVVVRPVPGTPRTRTT